MKWNKIKKHWKTSRWSKYLSCTGVRAFAVFTGLSITVGVLTVCLTSPKNTNATCQMTFKRSAQHSTGYDSRPRHLTVGDFNNDRHQDIVVANSGTDNVGIFLGYGNGTFASQVTYSTGLGSHPYSVAVGDFNKDNHLDIVVANFGSNSIGVLFGYGNGHFASQRTISLGSSRPLALAIGNLNKDNQLDIAVASYGTSTVSILLGYNNGSFRIETIYDMGYDSIPYSLIVTDLNNDTHFDIVIVNYGTSDLVILLADGNGTFSSDRYSTGTGSHPCSIAIGDFNQDHKPDIAVANSGTSNVGIFLGYGNGTFTNVMSFPTGSNSRLQFIAVVDFSNDTKLDIVVADSGGNNVLVLKGNGNGSFSLLMTRSIGLHSDPCSIAIADFDNDKKPDIAITNNDTNSMVILTAYAVYPRTSQTTYPTGKISNPEFVAVGDFNNDNYLDIVAANAASNDISVFINLGNGTFRSGQVYDTEKDAEEQFICIGDFNNDSQLDIAVVMSGVSKLSVLLGYGNGAFKYGKMYSTGKDSSPSSITVGDFNNDTYLDIVTANYATDNVGIFLGYGDGTFMNVTTYPIKDGSGPNSVVVGDFNSDSILDIVTANFESGDIAILLGYGNGSFHIPMIISTDDDLPTCIAIGDINNDHRLDIVYSSLTPSIVGVLLGYGNGIFGSITKYSTGHESFSWSVDLGDFNNDTLLDIAVSNVFDYNIGVFMGFGNGSFAAQKVFSTGYGSFSYSLAFGDFNNDKQPDIVVSNSKTNNIGVFLVYEDADFGSATSYTTGSGPHPYSVAVGDFNNDSQSDIVVANSGTGDIQVLFDYNKGSFMSNVTYSTGFGSYPKCVAIADFNKDKQLDIVVANSRIDAINVFLGFGNGTFDTATTYSTGSGSSPSSIAVSDFNNDSWMDIVVANQGADNIAVFIAFDYVMFTNQSMYITGIIPTPSYVVAGDFNSDHEWDIVVADKNNGNIGVYLGYGNRTFARPIMHSTGTSSSPVSIAVGDFNSDHHLDIVVANSETSNIGVFLGYGNGSFETQMEYKTGDSSSPVSVAIGDFNNDNISDIAVSNRNTNNVGLFLGYGNGTFATQIPYYMPAGSSPVWVAVNDFNNDHRLDIAVANIAANNIGILFGNGNGTFREVISYSTGNNSGPRSIATGDFNKNGWMDIAVANQIPETIAVFSNAGDGISFSISEYSTDFMSVFQSIFVEDVNNDTKLDILVTGVGEEIGMIYILFGFGDGNFTIPTVYSIGSYSLPSSIAICDFDNDGRVDLAVTNYRKANIFFMFQYGSERFVTPWIFSTGNGSRPSSVTVGDFDNDTQIDIAVANSGTNNIGIFRGKGDGTFFDQETYSTGNNSGPNSIFVGDFNNDYQLDIAVANSNANNIAILLGRGNGSFAVVTTYSTGISSAPSSITIDDLNKDNHTDIVVVTSGTNEILVFYGLGNGAFLDPKLYSLDYNARPQFVTIGDINNDSLLDIVVANFGADYVEIFLQTC